ncbi:RHS repeat-associated core domain-containing protein [Chitiniphilus shinanonensis]|uniref:RHS repeat-associated core domain-containing protein n=1 Tax=Chitiniphilus shinanonensis TaxID=553088 RepID=UPI00306F4FC7
MKRTHDNVPVTALFGNTSPKLYFSGVGMGDREPLGQSSANANPDNDGQQLVFNLRFPGQYFDAETGRYYNYFRDYDPRIGWYIQSDPIGLAGGLIFMGM